jgi:hypothetical protein
VNALRVSRAQLRSLVLLVIVLAALAGLSFVARAYAPTTVAGAAELAAQRASAERSIDKVYKTGLEQLKTTRGLHLAITDAQAAAIEQKYATQLRDLRHNALQAIADLYALPADQATAYVQQTESRLDTQAAASAAPVMLAPRLYVVVQRMAELGAQFTDAGIREMTQSPTGSPAPSAAPTVTPTARPSASPSPSASR